MRKSADDHFNQNTQEIQTFSSIVDEMWEKMEKSWMVMIIQKGKS